MSLPENETTIQKLQADLQTALDFRICCGENERADLDRIIVTIKARLLSCKIGYYLIMEENAANFKLAATMTAILFYQALDANEMARSIGPIRRAWRRACLRRGFARMQEAENQRKLLGAMRKDRAAIDQTPDDWIDGILLVLSCLPFPFGMFFLACKLCFDLIRNRPFTETQTLPG